MFIDSIPTAAAKGLPPNVEPCVPGVILSIIWLSAKTADTGNIPPERAFPKTKYLV